MNINIKVRDIIMWNLEQQDLICGKNSFRLGEE